MSYCPFSHSHLEDIAQSFRRTHGKFDGKRFLIEYVVDAMGIELVPVEGLKDEEAIEAYLPKRPNTIIVNTPRDLFDTFKSSPPFSIPPVADVERQTLRSRRKGSKPLIPIHVCWAGGLSVPVEPQPAHSVSSGA